MSRQSTSRERTHATGKITVTTYEPTSYDQPEEGPALVTIHVVEGFSGDIEGEGAATFLQTTTADGKASFVGVERVTGTIGGRSGTFVLQDQGTLENSVVSGEWFVVPGSGTGELSRLRGEGGFRAAEGQAQTSPSTLVRMSRPLDGKVAIVIGGATGIGTAIAVGSPGETCASTAQRCELEQRIFDPGWPRTHACRRNRAKSEIPDMSIER